MDADPDERGAHATEWQAARDLLKAYDDNLHDLRKYGFSFVTALLAAEAVLTPSSLGGKALPDSIKLAVFAVTLLLIVALHLIDRNYSIIERAAASRAIVLERELNIELSEVIAYRHGKNHVNEYVFGLYLTFAIGVAVLGGAVLYPNVLYIAILGAVALGTMGLTWWTVRLQFFDNSREEDWTLSPLQCKRREMVRITLTNLSGKTENKIAVPILIPKDSVVWEIETQDGEPIDSKKAESEIKVYDNYTWEWDTSKAPKGPKDSTTICRVRPRGWVVPLHRRIFVVND